MDQHRFIRPTQVFVTAVIAIWLATSAASVRGQDVICCKELYSGDGNWFGALRDCKKHLPQMSPQTRAKICSALAGKGCCPEAAAACNNPALDCTAAPPRGGGGGRPRLPNPSASPSPSAPPGGERSCTDPTMTPTISIDLSETLDIDQSPQMPEIRATATVSPESYDITWEAQIKFTARSGCSGGPQFDSPKISGTGGTFTPDFGAIFGGKLEIKAKTTCGSGAETTITRDLGGLNAAPADVRTEIGTMGAPLEADDLKKIACHESRQRQFESDKTPTSGPGGDAGIMQICFQRTVGDLWNWKINIARGRANLLEKVPFARGIPNKVRRQVVRGQGPFPNAKPFTDAQVRLEAIKRYNAGNELDVGYWQWDDASGEWVASPQGGGDPNYVANVLGQNANCP